MIIDMVYLVFRIFFYLPAFYTILYSTRSLANAQKVYICDNTIVIPNKNGVWESQFDIEFRPQLLAPAEVNCSVSSDNGAAALQFLSVNVAATSTNTKITYRIIEKVKFSISAICSAQSTGSSVQYTHRDSVSQPASFVLDTGSAYIQPSDLSTIHSTTYVAIITVDQILPQPLEFTCGVYTFLTLNDVSSFQPDNCTTSYPLTNGSSADTTQMFSAASADGDTMQWFINNNNNTIVLTQGANQLSFNVQRRELPLSNSTTEYVVVSCCTSRAEYRFQGLYAESKVKFEYVYRPAVNDSSAISGQRVIQNPAYIELAPCPCDLSTGCDVQCCCDSDCSDVERELFSRCAEGVLGGFQAEAATHWCQRSNELGAADWAPLLCTVYETNSHLGLFYPISEPISLSGSYPAYGNSSSYRYSFPIQSTLTSSDSGYKNDYPLISILSSTETGYLTLPNSLTNGQCVHTPIRYFQNVDNSCTTKMTAGLCSADTKLNANNYLQKTGNTEFFDPCQSIIRVQREYVGAAYADVETVFRCTNDLSEYTSLKNEVKTQSRNYLYSNVSQQAASQDALVTCEWDDGESLPPSPVLNGDTCQNAVVSVSYDIQYNGSKIVKVVASYVMADIPLTTIDKTVYTVKSYNFTETRYRQTSLTTRYSAMFSRTGVSNPIIFSGRPGYNFDASLNIAAQELGTLSYKDAPSMPDPDFTGLCEFSSTRSIVFPYNQVTQCQVEVSRNDLADCATLRDIIYNKMETLFPVLAPSLYISRFGSPDLKKSSHWIPIIRVVDDYSQAINEFTTDVFDVLSNESISSNEGCQDIPTRAQLQVLYALTGSSSSVPIYQVVGAKVSVSASTWSQSCILEQCRRNDTEKHALSFSTEFIEVPSQQPEEVQRYYRMKSGDCEECVPPWKFDLVFYPIGSLVPPQFRAVNIAMFLFLIACVVAFWVISRPWWHKHFIV